MTDGDPIPAAAPVVRPLVWTGAGVRLLDQTRLPDEVVYLEVTDVDEVIDAIRRLAVRGAPALGALGAFGVALVARRASRDGWPADRIAGAIERIRTARPTAVALALGVEEASHRLDAGVDAVVAAASELLARDERRNDEIARLGADWVERRLGRRPLRVVTHCNTGSLAAAGVGTALGIIRELHRRGRVETVYVDETRPLLQGSRLTAWELAVAGVPHRVQVDGAAAGTILRGEIDLAVVGADRIAANGDVANKVGTVGVALACAYAGVPFVVAASADTVDPATPDGAAIPIERRGGEEVLAFQGRRVAPAASPAHNPAFDVTPAGLVTALVTEVGVTEPAAPDAAKPAPG
jgi:methylthioribose-1-phosphate isomerase